MAALEVLGMGCGSCVGLFKNAEEAVRQEGRSDRVEKITDYRRILALDPWALPALAIDGKVVVAGRIATVGEIRNYLVAASAPSVLPVRSAISNETSTPKQIHRDGDRSQTEV